MPLQREITRLTLHWCDPASSAASYFLAAIDSFEDSDEDIQSMIRRNFPVDAFSDTQADTKMQVKSIEKLIDEVIIVAVTAYTANQKLKGLKLDEPLTTDVSADTQLLAAQYLIRAERRVQS